MNPKASRDGKLESQRDFHDNPTIVAARRSWRESSPSASSLAFIASDLGLEFI